MQRSTKDHQAWVQWLFGENGPDLNETIPQLLLTAHNDMANAQTASRMDTNDPYGQMYKRVHQEFAIELPQHFPGVASPLRPLRAPYKIVRFYGVPVFPWRYSHDLKREPGEVPFGHPLSDTRNAIINGHDLGDHPTLFDVEHMRVTDEEREEDSDVARHRLAALAAEHPHVALVPYASHPDGLLSAFLGTGTLRSDGTIDFDYLEPFDLARAQTVFARKQLARAVGDGSRPGTPAVGDPARTFDGAPLEDSDIRLRD